ISTNGTTMIGEPGSIISSLDYAINKQPTWLSEMFGIDNAGRCIIYYLIERTNPGQRRNEPVGITMRSASLSPDNINVFYQGSRITDPEHLQKLGHSITGTETVLSAPQLDTSPTTTKSKISSWRSFLEEICLEELENSLAGATAYTKQQLKNLCSQVNHNPSYRHITSKLLETIDTTMPETALIGSRPLDALSILKSRNLAIASPAVSVGIVAIIAELQLQNLNCFSFDFQHHHAIEVASKIVSGSTNSPPELVSLGLPVAAWFMERSPVKYHPLMFIPGISKRIVASGKLTQPELSRGHYLFMNNAPSVASFYFSSMKERGVVAGSKIKVSHMEPIETLSLMTEADSDLRAILFFPHYKIHQLKNQSAIVDDIVASRQNTENILLIREDLARDSSLTIAITTLIRHGWLSLLASRDNRRAAIGAIVADNTYKDFLWRSTGMFMTKHDP
ncbi:MAG: hypothetical protein PHC51_11870, partial [bacterium]|nr:hypothetical protein [bacterium]